MLRPLLTALVLLAIARPAAAQTSDCFPRDELSTCIAADNLWPHAGGGRWFSHAPTQTAAEGAVSFGFVPSFIYQPIGLRVSSPDPEGTTIYAVEAALGATFLAGLGVTDRLEVGFAAPVVLFQEGASKADIVGSDQRLPRSAIGDLRFGARFGILERAGDAEGVGLSARFEIAAPSAQADAFSGHASASYAPGIAFDHRIGDFSWGVDVGGRFRRAVLLATNVIGSQLTVSAGAGYDFLDDGWLSANLEAFAVIHLSAQYDLEQGNFESDVVDAGPLVPAEWLLSARTAGMLDGRFRISLGGGSFIPTSEDVAVTTPTFRLALGLHYVLDVGGDDSEEPAVKTDAAAP